MRSKALMSSMLPLGIALLTGVISAVTAATMDCSEPSRASVRDNFSVVRQNLTDVKATRRDG